MILKELKIITPIGEPTNCYIVFDENSKEAMIIDLLEKGYSKSAIAKRYHVHRETLKKFIDSILLS